MSELIPDVSLALKVFPLTLTYYYRHGTRNLSEDNFTPHVTWMFSLGLKNRVKCLGLFTLANLRHKIDFFTTRSLGFENLENGLKIHSNPSPCHANPLS